MNIGKDVNITIWAGLHMDRIAPKFWHPFSTMMEVNIQCFVCEGSGRFYVGESDPVEGHKLSERRNCDCCYGGKSLNLDTPRGKACFAFYEALAIEDVAKKEKLAAIQRQRVEIVSKLSDAELEILGTTRESLVR